MLHVHLDLFTKSVSLAFCHIFSIDIRAATQQSSVKTLDCISTFMQNFHFLLFWHITQEYGNSLSDYLDKVRKRSALQMKETSNN